MPDPVIKAVVLKDVKTKYPQILQELDGHIAKNCKHGASMAFEIADEGQTTHLCCLQCAVDYIMKVKAMGKITSREGSVSKRFRVC